MHLLWGEQVTPRLTSPTTSLSCYVQPEGHLVSGLLPPALVFNAVFTMTGMRAGCPQDANPGRPFFSEGAGPRGISGTPLTLTNAP